VTSSCCRRCSDLPFTTCLLRRSPATSPRQNPLTIQLFADGGPGCDLHSGNDRFFYLPCPDLGSAAVMPGSVSPWPSWRSAFTNTVVLRHRAQQGGDGELLSCVLNPRCWHAILGESPQFFQPCCLVLVVSAWCCGARKTARQVARKGPPNRPDQRRCKGDFPELLPKVLTGREGPPYRAASWAE